MSARGHGRRAGAGEVTVFACGAGWVNEDLLRVDCVSGYDPLIVWVAEGGTAERDLRVIPAGRVKGRVLDPDGAPLANARARALQFDGRRGGCGSNMIGANDYPFVPDPPPVTTDTSGAYEIDALLPGVRYQTDGFAEGFEAVHERVEAIAGETATFDLRLGRLAPEWYVDVEVRERATGRPIPGARAWRSRTDQAGFARIGPLRGGCSLGVCADGYFPGDLDADPPADPTNPAPTRRVVVLLDRAATIAGRVLGPDGAPAGCAVVQIGQPVDRSQTWCGTRTDEQGRFTFSRDPTDEAVRLFAAWEHAGRRFTGEAPAAPGDEEVEIRLDEEPIDARLLPRTVTVRGASGLAVPRAALRIYTVEPPVPGREREPVRVAKDYAYVCDGACLIAPERVPFRLEIEGAADAERQPLPLGAVLLGPWASTAALPAEIVLPPARRIAGRVLDESGVPLAHLVVEAQVRYPRWEDAEVEPPRNVHATARTDEKGRFHLECLGDFDYCVTVRTPLSWSRPEAPVVRAGGAPVVIRLCRTEACTVTVLDAVGEPVAKARVRARAQNVRGSFALSAPPDAVTRRDGRCLVEGLAPGKRYVLLVHPPFGRRDLWAVSIEGWSPVDTTVRFAAAVAVEGVVVDPVGRGIGGAHVVARRGEKGMLPFYAFDFADDEGRFHLRAVPPGRARIKVERGPFLSSTFFDVDVPGGPLRLVCPRGRTVEVRLAGALPTGCKVGWRIAGPGSDGRARNARGPTPFEGHFLLEHLVPGRADTLFVEVPEAGLVGHVSALDADAGTFEVLLVAARTLTGRVLHPRGASRVPGARVRFRIGSLEWNVEGADDGTFEIPHLPPGRGVLSARVAIDEQWFRARLGTESGSTVEVLLAPDAR